MDDNIVCNKITISKIEPRIRICSLNVCGLRSKLINPDFLSFIQLYDMLIFQETKTDELDLLDLQDGYSYFAKHRNMSKGKSGGIIIVFKSNLSKYLNLWTHRVNLYSGLKFQKTCLT